MNAIRRRPRVSPVRLSVLLLASPFLLALPFGSHFLMVWNINWYVGVCPILAPIWKTEARNAGPKVLEKLRDVVPQVANFVLLAEGQNVVSPNRKKITRGEKILTFLREIAEADTQFVARWTPPHKLM